MENLESIRRKLDLSQQQALAYSRDFAKVYRLELERRRKLLEINQKLRAILHSMSDLVAATDNRGVIEEANPAFLREFAPGNQQVVGKTLAEAVGTDEPERVARSLEGEQERTELLEYEFPSLPFRYFDISVARISMLGRQTRGYVFVFRDVTERVRFERLRKRFITFASHEINTPLQGLLGLVHQLYENLKDRLSDEELANFRFLMDSGENLRDLVEDLTHFSPGIVSRNELEPVPLRVALDRAIERIRLDIESVGIKIVKIGDIEGSVQCEPEVLSKAFESVLKTFVIYSGLDAEIHVWSESERGQVKVHFRSTESPEKLTELRELFHRASRDEGSQLHMGLGLALAMDVVNWLGGNLSYQDLPHCELIMELPERNRTAKNVRET